MRERFSKIAELWQALPSGKKVTFAVALVGVLVMSAFFISYTGGSEKMRVLVSGADPKDLSEVVEALNAKQIPFEYNEAGDSILVPEDKRAEMRMELAMKGLPKKQVMSVSRFLMKETLVLVISYKELIILVLFKVN